MQSRSDCINCDSDTCGINGSSHGSGSSRDAVQVWLHQPCLKGIASAAKAKMQYRVAAPTLLPQAVMQTRIGCINHAQGVATTAAGMLSRCGGINRNSETLLVKMAAATAAAAAVAAAVRQPRFCSTDAVQEWLYQL